MATEPDYYVVTREAGERPDRWRWEIRRRSRPMGVSLSAGGYQSQAAAHYAGNKALAEFLEEIAKEERRK